MRPLQARSDYPVRSRFSFLPVPPEFNGPWLPAIPPPSSALLPGLRGRRVKRRGYAVTRFPKGMVWEAPELFVGKVLDVARSLPNALSGEL